MTDPTSSLTEAMLTTRHMSRRVTISYLGRIDENDVVITACV
jgi:hypothetical protein